MLHEQGCSVGPGSGQFGTFVLERNAVREGTRPSLIAAGLGKRSRVVSSVTVHSNVHTSWTDSPSERVDGVQSACSNSRSPR